MPPAEARRRARIEFGHVEKHRDQARASLGLATLDRLGFSWLDFKVGLRMLVRYPGLTVMALVAMGVAITFGAGFFEFTSQWANPRLSFDPEHRLVGITVRDSERQELETRILHDFEAWREGLRSFDEVGAFRAVGRNLDTGIGSQLPVQVTEISASAFRVTRTSALLGRTLVDEDERVDAAHVVVLGYDLWQSRFGGAPEVVGRTVRLGDVPTSVVGVMPEGFEFPHSQNLWAPLRLNAVEYPVRGGPGIYVFGRLAPGTTIEQAHAELTTTELAVARARGGDGNRIAARVIPYPELVYMPIPGFFDPAFLYMNLFILSLAVVFCANVGLLLFARAASRESELVVRSALGAGRNRIVMQLLSEALVLAAIAVVLGLVGARYGYEWFLTVIESEGKLPFWYVATLSPTTLAYVVVLALAGAGVAGVLPGLKVTRGLATRLRTSTAGGGGLGFGGVWTLVIVAQVAVTVPLSAFGYLAADEIMEGRAIGSALPEQDQYLAVTLRLERDTESASLQRPGSELASGASVTDTAFLSRYAGTLDELERRLLEEPAVDGVTFADRLPLTYNPFHQVELDAGAVEPPDARGHRVGRSEVEVDYFETLQAPVLAGRVFDSEDVVSGARVVVVDEPFVDRVLGGRHGVGRLVRYVAAERGPQPDPDGPWYEIIGVVGDLGVYNGYGQGGVYHPVARGAAHPAGMLVHVRGDAASYAATVRSLAADLDRSLRLDPLVPLDELREADAGITAWLVSAVTAGTITAIMLSLAGLYAIMSFTVTRRTREIGVRVALGAQRSRLVLATFRRPILQLSLGIAAGAALLVLVTYLIYERQGLTARQYALLSGHVTAMFGICLLSCVVPMRRALRIEPMEALNVEG
jgi:predicted permease